MQISQEQLDLIQEYNKEPVYYCSCCLSLAIRTVENLDYCDHCGNTVINQSTISEWETMYKERYGKAFINKK